MIDVHYRTAEQIEAKLDIKDLTATVLNLPLLKIWYILFSRFSPPFCR